MSQKSRFAIDGGFNFRDLGGYKTTDGRVVRHGRIYRSGVMTHISDAGRKAMAEMGIRLICDFRTTRERNENPTRWQDAGVGDYWSRDYDTSDGEIHRLMKSKPTSPDQARDVMIQSYRNLAFEQKEGYRHLFHKVAGGHLPVVFNCTAGKDRTGVAAALLLAALNVPRDVIIEDYALTNERIATDADDLVKRGAWKNNWNIEAAFMPIVKADPDYLAAMFESLDKKSGSVQGFLKSELGIDKTEITAIQNEMLER